MIYKERKCRVCGCTWHQACPGGCSWVEIDLCSACVGKETHEDILIPYEEAVEKARQLLDEDRPIPTRIGRALLMGYQAATMRGQWTTLTQICDGYGIMHYFHKECKGPHRSELFRSPHPFCPNCGANMRGPEPGREESK